jgi:predicted HTH domain antitoxin
MLNIWRTYEMPQFTLELPETVFSALRASPEEFLNEMRVAAAVKWYERGQVSQGKAAEIAGLSRTESLQALSRFQVCPFQYTREELEAELQDAESCSRNKPASHDRCAHGSR